MRSARRSKRCIEPQRLAAIRAFPSRIVACFGGIRFDIFSPCLFYTVGKSPRMDRFMDVGHVAETLPDLSEALNDPRLRQFGLVGGVVLVAVGAFLSLAPASGRGCPGRMPSPRRWCSRVPLRVWPRCSRPGARVAVPPRFELRRHSAGPSRLARSASPSTTLVFGVELGRAVRHHARRRRPVGVPVGAHRLRVAPDARLLLRRSSRSAVQLECSRVPHQSKPCYPERDRSSMSTAVFTAAPL